MKLSRAALYTGILLTASCSNSLDDARLITTRANANIESGTGVEIRYTENGKTKIKAVAPRATRHQTERPYLEFTEGIKIFFYDNQSNVESILTARYATAVENTKEMIARNDVVVVNANGDKLNTEELIWDEEKQIIYSNEFVKITTPDEIIYGNGMTANQNFTDYVIKNITGTIKVKATDLPQ